jgi:hypothetical protein
MNGIMILYAFGFLYLSNLANCISMQMDSARSFYCLKISAKNNSVIDGSFLVSGESEHDVTFRVCIFRKIFNIILGI